MRNKAVTVFGGSGFIGRHLVRRLAERGATVRVPTRHPERAMHLQPMGDVGQIVLIACGRPSPEAIDELVAGASYAVNLVGILHEARPGDFQRLQADLPGHVARAARKHGVERMVQLSAIGADPASDSDYARTKALGEQAVRDVRPDAVVLRPSIVFGPEDSFFNRFSAMARLSPALPLIGGGATRFQPVYVGDVADAIMLGLERADMAGQTYELGGPRIYTFKDLMRYVLQVSGRKRFLVPLPWNIAELQARFAEFLPNPPLTRDQLKLLKRDNVVSPSAKGFDELGINPEPIEVVVPRYLAPYGPPTIRMPVA